jgi:hypothetical protein
MSISTASSRAVSHLAPDFGGNFVSIVPVPMLKGSSLIAPWSAHAWRRRQSISHEVDAGSINPHSYNARERRRTTTNARKRARG